VVDGRLRLQLDHLPLGLLQALLRIDQVARAFSDEILEPFVEAEQFGVPYSQFINQ